MSGVNPALSEREATTVMVLTAMDLLNVAGLRVALVAWCGFDPADAEA